MVSRLLGRIPRTLRSGRLYDYSKFNHQVLNFGFPDHHSPPLDLLFQIIVSMDNWLSASPEHVAVIHCVGGKGAFWLHSSPRLALSLMPQVLS